MKSNLCSKPRGNSASFVTARLRLRDFAVGKILRGLLLRLSDSQNEEESTGESQDA